MLYWWIRVPQFITWLIRVPQILLWLTHQSPMQILSCVLIRVETCPSKILPSSHTCTTILRLDSEISEVWIKSPPLSLEGLASCLILHFIKYHTLTSAPSWYNFLLKCTNLSSSLKGLSSVPTLPHLHFFCNPLTEKNGRCGINFLLECGIK